MHTLKLIQSFLKVNLQIALAYRVDTLVNILINLLWLGVELLGLQIIFSNTDTLAGWGPGELVSLLGVFRLVNMLMVSVIWPATEKFNASVRDGTLDYTLIQPANSLFLVSFSRIVLWRVWDLVLAIGLIVVGIRMSARDLASLTGGVTSIASTASMSSMASLVSFLLLLGSGALVLYSLWVVLIALTFWFVKFDNNVTILQALLDSGRYPVSVYPPWLRIIVTYLVPIAVATTIPLQGLRGDLNSLQVLMFLGVGVACFLVALRVWKAGVRQYSGASS
jgi:ABC-2 type transport system permease protein